MPASFSVTIDKGQLSRLTRELSGIKNGVVRASVAAINRTVATGRTRISRKIRQEVNLKTEEVNKVITVGKATNAKLVGTIKISRRLIPLYKFGPNPNRPGPTSALGVTVKVRKKGKRELLKHTFVAEMKSGHVGIFERRGRGAQRSRRLPIEERFGPSVLGLFDGLPGFAEQTLSELGDVLERNLDSQVNRLLARRKI